MDTGANTAVKPFAAWAQEQRGGLLHQELSEILAEVVRQCAETGKVGKLTLAIGVKPNKDGKTVTVTDGVTVKLPEGDRGESLFYFDGDGNLSRRDPEQPAPPLRQAPAGEPPAEPVAAAGGASS